MLLLEYNPHKMLIVIGEVQNDERQSIMPMADEIDARARCLDFDMAEKIFLMYPFHSYQHELFLL